MQTPLHSAAIQGESKAAISLIELGAVVDSKDRDLKTFMHHASANGHYKFLNSVFSYQFSGHVSEALEQALAIPDISGRTPLLCAAAAVTDGLDTVKILAAAKADVFAGDADKSTALHHAAKIGDEQLLSYLTQKLDINKANSFGFSALHVAVEHSNLRSARYLLQHKADVNARSASNDTALSIAQASDNQALIRLIQNEVSIRAEELAALGSTDIIPSGPPLKTADSDDVLAFGSDSDSAQSRAAMAELEKLRRENAQLKAANEELKEKLIKKTRLLDLVKQKLGLQNVDENNEEQQLRACKTECNIM